ncbi:MAG: fibronectin type III domain-containing protein [Treponema sp.]|nr:fibronectin type III domain-containing protein [Treponema sp.]
MRNLNRILAVSLLVLLSGGLYAVGEKTINIGGEAGWETVDKRIGVTELSAARPYPVLALSSATRYADEQTLDLGLSFDEEQPIDFKDRAGHYQILISPALLATEKRLARSGAGAAMFSGLPPFLENANNGPLVLVPQSGALLSSGEGIRDFSIEFWLFPMNMENGELILSWTATREDSPGDYALQRIQCTASKNRLQWLFQNFFAPPGAEATLVNISLTGITPLVPRTWSNHVIRFNADTGLLEYLVNGVPEAITYATSSGRESGQLYRAVAGREGTLMLGGRFIGMMDEFRIYGSFIGDPILRKYHQVGGRAETRVFDLGEYNSSVLRVDVNGGRITYSGEQVQNEYAGAWPFRFTDGSTLQFFIRAGDNPYQWTETPAQDTNDWRLLSFEEVLNNPEWRAFTPETELSGIRGRFVQIAVMFYPGNNNETTPYLDRLTITYQPDEPPLAPTLLTAIARDSAVDLSWRASFDADVAGYLVYYGEASGRYFGEGALLGNSPINVGKRTLVHIDGLQNGTLYYFVVVAYDRFSPLHLGAFSREVSARPLRTGQ